MGFKPDYTWEILPEENFTAEMETVHRQMNACRREGYFDSFDRKPLYYEAYLAEASIGSVVIVHGCSEFTSKYHEMAWYFLCQGYNVFLYDQRGHGFSFRMTDPVQLVHVDSFRDYVEDLACFIRQVVQPLDDRPFCLYSHSMGGAVAALLLARNEFPVHRAVFSAPMIQPVVRNVPGWLANAAVFTVGLFKGWDKKTWISGEFDPNREFKKERDACEARYTYYLNLRRKEERYQSTPLSLGWNRRALAIHRKVLRAASKIQTPSLILSAGKDTVVRNDMQAKFARKHPDCKLVTLENATHAMQAGTSETLKEHVTMTLDFFAK